MKECEWWLGWREGGRERRLLGVPAGGGGGGGGGRAVLLSPLQSGEQAGGQDGPQYLEQGDAHTQTAHVHYGNVIRIEKYGNWKYLYWKDLN